MERAINFPTKTVDDADYAAECQFELQTSFHHLLEEAKKAGWDELQVVLSLVTLCDIVIYGDDPDIVQAAQRFVVS